MAGFGSFLKRLLQRERIDSAQDLQRFWAARSAFIAQKCVIEYCRARAGLNWQRLFSEASFQQAVHAASWRAWRITLLDVAEMLDATLRSETADMAALHGWLRQAGAEIIAEETTRQTLPSVLPADFADHARQRLDALLATLAERPPMPVKDIARARTAEVFAAIPIHPDLKAPDEDYIFNTQRVYLVRAADDLVKRADLARLARQLEVNGASGRVPGHA